MKCYDLIGIGFGPSNISLAIQLENKENFSYKFLEAADDSIWQKNMLLDKSDIQNHPIRDLISLINPRSKYTFTNYLFENNRLYEYLNLGVKYPLRHEYAKYVEWCASHFRNVVEYKQSVNSIELVQNNNEGIFYYKVITNHKIYYCKSLVIATGRTPYIPKVFDTLPKDKVFHLTKYLKQVNKLDKNKKYNFAVIGASQSAVEIILDLKSKFFNSSITNFIRKFSIKLKDTSPFSYEIYHPKSIDLFYNLSLEQREAFREDLKPTNYSTVDADVLHQLYLEIYEQKLLSNQTIFIQNNTKINSTIEQEEKILINYQDLNTINKKSEFDFVILATGFKDIGFRENQERFPYILRNVINHFEFNKLGYIEINRDYSLVPKHNNLPLIYLNGLCETSHGLGDAGSFSSISIRNNYIIQSLSKNLQ